MKKLAGTAMAHSTPPNLNANTFVPEKQNTKITTRNKNNSNLKNK
jgi:hypothetical protein